MYRVLLSLAFLVFCSAAPYGGDLSSARSFPIRQEQQFIQQPQQQFVQQPQPQQFVQQPTSFSGGQPQQQSDDTDIVDTLGAGYSYFRKQPVGSRPLVQQKLAISEQQIPLSSLDDTSNQWNDYTKASAFKQQPAQNQIFTASNDLLADGGYGQQPAPRTAMNIIKTLGRPEQGAYGTALDLSQQDMPSIFEQQQPLQVIQPLIRNLGNSYGQQQQQLDQPMFPVKTNNGYGQQAQPAFDNAIRQDSYGQQTLVQPTFKALNTGYGQQQQQQFDKPVITIKTNSGYGQQAQPAFDNAIRQDSYGQQILVQPTFKALNTGYGQQQQQLDQSMFAGKTNSGYGQQQLDQPTFKAVNTGYGQQQQLDQPTFKAVNTGYGQQQQLDQPMFPVKTNSGYGQQQLDQPTFKAVNTGYGQQQLDQPTFKAVNTGYGQQQQLDQPTLRTISTGGYGQQQQQFDQPTFKALNTGYGQQQQQLDQPMFPVKTNSGYGQQQLDQPTLRTINSGYGQQQPAVQLSDNRPSNGY